LLAPHFFISTFLFSFLQSHSKRSFPVSPPSWSVETHPLPATPPRDLHPFLFPSRHALVGRQDSRFPSTDVFLASSPPSSYSADPGSTTPAVCFLATLTCSLYSETHLCWVIGWCLKLPASRCRSDEFLRFYSPTLFPGGGLFFKASFFAEERTRCRAFFQSFFLPPAPFVAARFLLPTAASPLSFPLIFRNRQRKGLCFDFFLRFLRKRSSCRHLCAVEQPASIPKLLPSFIPLLFRSEDRLLRFLLVRFIIYLSEPSYLLPPRTLSFRRGKSSVSAPLVWGHSRFQFFSSLPMRNSF